MDRLKVILASLLVLTAIRLNATGSHLAALMVLICAMVNFMKIALVRKTIKELF